MVKIWKIVVLLNHQNKEVVVGVVMIKMYRRRCRCKRGCVDKDENAHVWIKREDEDEFVDMIMKTKVYLSVNMYRWIG